MVDNQGYTPTANYGNVSFVAYTEHIQNVNSIAHSHPKRTIPYQFRPKPIADPDPQPKPIADPRESPEYIQAAYDAHFEWVGKQVLQYNKMLEARKKLESAVEVLAVKDDTPDLVSSSDDEYKVAARADGKRRKSRQCH